MGGTLGGHPLSAPTRLIAEAEPRTLFEGLVQEALGRTRVEASPLAAAYLDWAAHLVSSPGKQMQLVEKAARKWQRLARYAAYCALQPKQAVAPCIEPLPQDRRFRGEAW